MAAKISKNGAILAMLVGGIIMGASPIFVREADIGAVASAFWRVALALPFLAIWAGAENGRKFLALPRNGLTAAAVAGAFFAGDLAFWHFAILNTTIANATFMVCLSSVWVAVFSGVILGEKVTAKAWGGVAMCLIGLSMLIHSSMLYNPQNLLGDFCGLVTSVFLGAYMIVMRSARREMKSGSLFLVSTSATTIVLFFVCLLLGETFLPREPSGWISLLGLGVLTHVGGQGLLTIALGTLNALFSSLVIFVEALTAAVTGWLVYDEAMSVQEMIGGLLILIGIWTARPISE